MVWAGVNPEISAVRLLSSPQQTQAAATSIAASRLANPPGMASTMPPARERAAASHVRAPTCSRNTAQANSVVATVSKLSHSETDEEGAADKPSISKTGPITPPNTTAPANSSRSLAFLGNPAEPPRLDHGSTPNAPPMYKSPANRSGPSPSSSAFAAGVDAPKRTAAKRQRTTGRFTNSAFAGSRAS